MIGSGSHSIRTSEQARRHVPRIAQSPSVAPSPVTYPPLETFGRGVVPSAALPRFPRLRQRLPLLSPPPLFASVRSLGLTVT